MQGVINWCIALSVDGYWLLFVRMSVSPFTPTLLTQMGLPLAILTLRVWAVWNRNGQLGAALSVFYFSMAAAGFLVMTMFLRGLECKLLVVFIILSHFHHKSTSNSSVSDRPYSSFQGCFISGSNKLVYINWVLLMIYDAGKRNQPWIIWKYWFCTSTSPDAITYPRYYCLFVPILLKFSPAI